MRKVRVLAQNYRIEFSKGYDNNKSNFEYEVERKDLDSLENDSIEN